MIASCRCGRQWTGLAQAHCPTCHAHFGSVRGFDRHRSTGQCADPAGITRKDGEPFYKAAQTTFGSTWVEDNPRGHYRNAAAAPDAVEAAR